MDEWAAQGARVCPSHVSSKRHWAGPRAAHRAPQRPYHRLCTRLVPPHPRGQSHGQPWAGWAQQASLSLRIAVGCPLGMAVPKAVRQAVPYANYWQAFLTWRQLSEPASASVSEQRRCTAFGLSVVDALQEGFCSACPHVRLMQPSHMQALCSPQPVKRKNIRAPFALHLRLSRRLS